MRYPGLSVSAVSSPLLSVSLPSPLHQPGRVARKMKRYTLIVQIVDNPVLDFQPPRPNFSYYVYSYPCGTVLTPATVRNMLYKEDSKPSDGGEPTCSSSPFAEGVKAICFGEQCPLARGRMFGGGSLTARSGG